MGDEQARSEHAQREQHLAEHEYLTGRVNRLELELELARDEREAERRRRSNELWLYVGLLAGAAYGYYYARRFG